MPKSDLVPWIEESQLEAAVRDFRERHTAIAERARARLGVREHYFPIEHVVDLGVHVDIVPVPGLYRRLGGISGYLATDKTAIFVDEECSENREDTYRFTLAHEVAHLEMHSDVWDAIALSAPEEEYIFSTPEEKYIHNMHSVLTGDDYSRLEWQANAFASLLLVPSEHLAGLFRECAGEIEEKAERLSGRDPQTVFNIGLAALCRSVAAQFGVHEVTIGVRADYNGLTDELAVRLFGENHGIETRRRLQGQRE